jgi:hypothetical protein
MANEARFVVDQLSDFTKRVMVTVGLEVHAEVTERTPIDVGWARRNWIPSVGSPAPTVETPATREGREQALASRAAQQEQGVLELFSYKLGSGPIYIVNGVPYIGRLNEGHSAQAPSGFVQKAIQDGISSARAKL